MRNGQINDVVLCPTVGDGDFKIIALAEGGVVRVQAANRPLDLHWVYEHHCEKQLGKSLASHFRAGTK